MKTFKLGDRVSIIPDVKDDSAPKPFYGLTDPTSSEPQYFVTALFITSDDIRVALNFCEYTFSADDVELVSAEAPPLTRLAAMSYVNYEQVDLRVARETPETGALAVAATRAYRLNM